jgi:hypothetical protein
MSFPPLLLSSLGHRISRGGVYNLLSRLLIPGWSHCPITLCCNVWAIIWRHISWNHTSQDITDERSHLDIWQLVLRFKLRCDWFMLRSLDTICYVFFFFKFNDCLDLQRQSCQGCKAPPKPPKPEIKKKRFCRYYEIKRFTFGRNKPLKSTDE